MTEEEILEELLLREESKVELGKFCTHISDIQPARHHQVLCEKLEDIAYGNLKRLMVFMPPGHAKSTYSSVHFPAFFLGVNPEKCIIGASHTVDLAERFSRKTRNIVSGREFYDLYGFGLALDSRSMGSWETERGGEYKAAGVGSGIAGRRSDVGLIDDPIRSREDAESELVRERTWEWYLGDFWSRLKPEAAVIIIQTRWHEDDLAGRLLPTDYHGQSGPVEGYGGEVWEVINFPAICEQNDDPLGRKIGEALWPEYFNIDILNNIKNVQTPRNWASLYQQRPRAEESNQFDLAKLLVEGQPLPFPKWCDSVYAVIDTASKDGNKHDATAVTYFAYNRFEQHSVLILDWEIVQIEGALLEEWLPSVFTKLDNFSSVCGARLGSQGVFIEDKASGTILLQQAARKGMLARPIESPLVNAGKTARAVSVSSYVYNGKVKLTENAYNKRETYKGRERNHLVFQVVNFRAGMDNKTDDLIDTFCYGIALALGNHEAY